MVIIALIIQRIFFGTQSMGWTSLMIAIMFFSGIQLIGIGILGEYIGRLYISNSGLPRSTVRETINCGEEQKKEEKDE